VIVDCAGYIDGCRVGTLEPSEVQDWLVDNPDGFAWLGLAMPDAAELTSTCSAFGLHDVDVGAILSQHRRPVVTLENDLTWVVLRTANYDDQAELVTLGEISLLATRRFLITVRHGSAPQLASARKELEADPELLREGVAAAVMAVVTAVVDSYVPALDGFEKDAIEVESEVLSESRDRPVRRLVNLSRQIRELQNAVESMEEPLDRLHRHHTIGWTVETLAELRSAITHVERVVRRTRSLIDLVTAAHNANLAQVAKQQNDDMRKISAWVAIAAVPTMIAAIYGMNFRHLPELEWRFGYPLVIGVMVAACVVLYRVFRRNGWL
jgi:magnesium transporter